MSTRQNLVLAFSLLLLAIPCKAETIIVDPNGSADFDNIQDAINYSSNGDTVIVRSGTYNENINFNGRAIRLTTEDPNDPNIVESTIITAASGYSVTFEFAEGSDSVLTGFTITGRGILCYDSSPTITENIIRDCDECGIYGQYNATPTISDNMIHSNNGRGIYSCNGLITNNIISENKGGIANCNGMISYNTISSNTAYREGGALHECSGTIINNKVSNNIALGGTDSTTGDAHGGGLYQCNGTIINNTVCSNRAIGGYYGYGRGGGLYKCNGTIINNTISGNRSTGTNTSFGGGLYDCGATISNNTVVGNKGDRGGALYNCNASVQNNIIAFNEAISVGGIYGFCDNSYNDLWMNQGGNWGGGATAGPGDIAVNPLFAVDGYWDGDTWVDSDYHLKSAASRWDPNSEAWVIDDSNSRCIDAGDPNSDWTGELWPHGKQINMGAYGGTLEASMSVLTVGNKADLNNDDNVNLQDFAYLADCWETEEVLLREDLNRDGYVDVNDLRTLVDNWLWEQ